MPKTKTSKVSKAKSFIDSFPKEFFADLKGSLFCKLCNCMVSTEKSFMVDSHRKSKKHQNMLKGLENQQSMHEHIAPDESTWAYRVTKAFLQSDIPLHKLKSEPLKNLFNSIGKPLPSESKSRSCVDSIFDSQIIEIQKIIDQQPIFLVVDESDVSGQKYVNVLVDLVAKPGVTYLVDCLPINSSPNTAMICTVIDDSLKILNVNRENFLLLISDAARYMVSAANTMKMLYPNLHNITCITHMLHNCALKIRSYYPEIDNLIACVKATTIKNRSRKECFKSIGVPPQPIVTRWGSWLSATDYYLKNLPKVAEIVNSFEDDGLLVKRAKEALSRTNLKQSLVEVSSYNCIIKLIENSESTDFSIESAMNLLNELKFEKDPCNIKYYIDSRIESNGINEIINMEKESVSPQLYGQLLQCQATSASVERSFSILNKLLAKDRNFNPANVKKYVCVLYNKVL